MFTGATRLETGSPVWVILGSISIAFHIALIFSGLTPNLVSRPIHLLLALPWIFLETTDNKLKRYSGWLLLASGVFICSAIALQHTSLGDQYGYLNSNLQLVLAAVLLLLVLELARRAIGWPLPLVAAVSLLYLFFGQHIQGEFGFSAIPPGSALGTLTIAEGGLWGKLTGISVNIIAIFVILGAVLNAGVAGEGFMNVASFASGRLKGGAAKVSIISSALFGSISGSASANVASTGSITLPTMTRLGYPRSVAAATEAVASSGGQIMPPLMGAGAFVMVELTGVPYGTIIGAALFPALAYFIVVWLGIDAYCKRYDLKPLPANELPGLARVLSTLGFFLIPFSILIWGIFGPGYTPQYAASLAILASLLMLATDARLTFSLVKFRQRLAAACINAGQQLAMITAIIVCASIVVGVLGMTGLGVKVTSLILSASGGQLWLALFLTAIACLALGMEVPTTAAYVICVSIAGPALIELGLKPLQAHLFVFWFALLSTITPPVCGAVFIAAGIVKENWLKVALHAMALGVGLYLIPVAMVTTPSLINPQEFPVAATAAFLKTLIALGFLANGLIAPAPLSRRLSKVVGGFILLLLPLSF